MATVIHLIEAQRLVSSAFVIVAFLFIEAFFGTPKLTKMFYALAVKRLPALRRERLSEEWKSHLNDVESRFGKLRASIGFLIAGYAIRRLPSESFTKAKSLSGPDSDVDPSAQFSAQLTQIIPLSELEKKTIIMTLERLNGDKMATARLLGIGKTTLYRKLREYGIAERWAPREADIGPGNEGVKPNDNREP